MTQPIRVRISDPSHPHFPETGMLTGEVIAVLGTPMALMTLDACRHGGDSCYIEKGQVTALDEQTPRRKRGAR